MSDLNLMSLKGKKRELNDFNDWGGYMRAKVRKLDEQFEVLDSNNDKSNALNNLFKDVVIFVNGYTVPSSDELKRLMKKHGGAFQHYYSRSKCTHIIATNLPDSKIKELKNEKVLHPDWIVESIEAGRLLPYRKYLLYGASRKYGGNKNLRTLISSSNTILNENSSESSRKNEDDAKMRTQKNVEVNSNPCSKNHGSSDDGENKEVLKDDVSESPELIKRSTSDSLLELGEESKIADKLDDIVALEIESKETSASSTLGNDIPFDTSEGIGGNDLLKSNGGKENCEKLEKGSCTNLKDIPAQSGTTVFHSGHQTIPQKRSRAKRKSVPKAGDENFVNDYYSHSRLHYLSTWGAEFRDFINNLIQTTELKTPRRSPQKNAVKKRVIMHIDMDSFFVSVALRSRPELRGKPVAVCHAGRGGDTNTSVSSFGSTSEIASCSYEARSLGVKNGMWLGQARQLCPGLVCVPYQFEQYRQVSQQLYEILASYTHEIQAVSCDEAFVDLAHYIETEKLTALEIAEIIRDEIKKKTDCPASAGIASNILLARMCTKVAKPNGQFHLRDDEVAEFIGKQKVAELPGVGFALNQKLRSLNVVTCAELQRISMSVLRREFGQKTGEMLYKYSRGQDDRQLKIERERKSVSAEINYAIRFTQESEPEKFIHDLSNEVHRRLKTAGVKGKQVTLKLRVRQKDAPFQPTKFMGCGRCDNMSRSTNMKSLTDDASVIARECIAMLKQLSQPVSHIRGMGIQICKLSDDNRKVPSSKTLHSFLKPIKTEETGKDSGEILAKGDKLIEGDGNFDRRRLEVGQVANDTEQKENFGGESSKMASCSTSHHVDENLDEFKLVLSEDEDEASCYPQDGSKTNMSAASCSKQRSQTCDGTSSTRQNLPPLPTFPMFSPKRLSPSSRKTSPNFGKKKRTPRKSPNKSPGKLSSQRSLYSTFKSSKTVDATETLALPSPSQIDPAVFDALPEEVKKDIEISYRRKNLRMGMNMTEQVPSTSSRAMEEWRYLPPPAAKNSKQVRERNETDAKKSKVKHKSIKSFASKKKGKDDDMVDLDASLLNALPESIRHEVRLAYEQQKRHDEKERRKQLNVDTSAPTTRANDPTEGEINAMGPSTVAKVQLAGVESLSEVREMLKLWTDETEAPSDEDVSVLIEYLNDLILHKDMEKMWLVLKYFRRLLVGKEKWQPFFNKVLDNVQNILNKNYGGQLSMEHFEIP